MGKRVGHTVWLPQIRWHPHVPQSEGPGADHTSRAGLLCEQAQRESVCWGGRRWVPGLETLWEPALRRGVPTSACTDRLLMSDEASVPHPSEQSPPARSRGQARQRNL